MDARLLAWARVHGGRRGGALVGTGVMESGRSLHASYDALSGPTKEGNIARAFASHVLVAGRAMEPNAQA